MTPEQITARWCELDEAIKAAKRAQMEFEYSVAGKEHPDYKVGQTVTIDGVTMLLRHIVLHEGDDGHLWWSYFGDLIKKDGKVGKRPTGVYMRVIPRGAAR